MGTLRSWVKSLWPASRQPSLYAAACDLVEVYSDCVVNFIDAYVFEEEGEFYVKVTTMTRPRGELMLCPHLIGIYNHEHYFSSVCRVPSERRDDAEAWLRREREEVHGHR